MDVPDELITVQEFANRYAVGTAVVRSWIRQRRINYTLVGPRHMKMVRPSDIVKPIEVENGPSSVNGGSEASGAVGNPEGAGRDAKDEEGTRRGGGSAGNSGSSS